MTAKDVTLRPPARVTIVVVDDSEICREIARLLLGEAGYEVITIRDPRDLLDVLRAARPSLVLADVNMPALSGMQLVELVRNEGAVDCPVVLHSDCTEAELENMVAACGATGFIRKTADGAKLRRAVERFLGAPS